MASRQTFGWTQLEQAPPGLYVKFIMTQVEEDGRFVLSVRNDDGKFVSIELPEAARSELARALVKTDGAPS